MDAKTNEGGYGFDKSKEYRSIDDVAEDLENPCIMRGGEDVFDACLVQPVLRLRNVGGHDQRKREYEQCFY